MLPLACFHQTAFSACIIFGVLMNLSYYGMQFVLTLYPQTAHGDSALQAGVAYLPLTATFILPRGAVPGYRCSLHCWLPVGYR